MAGSTEAEYTSFYSVVSANTFSVATYCPNPAAAPATVKSQLQDAFNAVIASGGTLNFPAGVTYTINGNISIGSGGGAVPTDFLINGNDCIIKALAGSGTYEMFTMRRCKNFHFQNLTWDGTRASRTGSSSNMTIFECNSGAIGGGRGSFDRCNWIESTFDGLSIRGMDSTGLFAVTRFPKNLLLYRCTAMHNSRMGFFVSNGNNLQWIGGESSFQTGQLPCSGFDFEPNNPATDGAAGCFDIRIHGMEFNENEGKAIHISCGKGGPNGGDKFTIEGCYSSGLDHDAEFTTTQGCFIHIIANNVLIQGCKAENFTQTNMGGMIVFASGRDFASANGLVIDNSCDNITTGDPVYKQSAGSGNVFQNNRSYNHTGQLQSGGATFTNNTTTAAPTNPIPVPPAFTPFAGDDEDPPVFPGGAIEFDAASTSGSEFTTSASWTHTPVGTPKGVLVLITQRSGFPIVDEIATVTYGLLTVPRISEGEAFDTASEGCGVYAHFLGSGLAAGAQTVAITSIAGRIGTYRAYAITVTADDDTQVDVSGVEAEDQANPTIVLATTPTVETFIAAALSSGTVNANVAVGADFTQINEYEQGSSRTMSFMRRTADATGGDVTVDWVATADDVAAIAVAISNLATENPNINVTVPTGFERLRGFGSVAVNITLPPSIGISVDGFERLREFGEVTLDLPVVSTIVITSPPSDELLFPSQRAGGMNRLLKDFRDNNIELQTGYNLATSGSLDVLTALTDNDIDQMLNFTGGLAMVIRRLRDNDIALNDAASLGLTLVTIPDSIINAPYMYSGGLLIILTALRDNDDAMLEVIDAL